MLATALKACRPEESPPRGFLACFAIRRVGQVDSAAQSRKSSRGRGSSFPGLLRRPGAIIRERTLRRSAPEGPRPEDDSTTSKAVSAPAGWTHA